MDSSGDRPPSASRRLLFTVGLTVVGYLAGTLLGDDRIGSLVAADPYFVTISALLAIGLYSRRPSKAGPVAGVEQALAAPPPVGAYSRTSTS